MRRPVEPIFDTPLRGVEDGVGACSNSISPEDVKGELPCAAVVSISSVRFTKSVPFF